MSVGWLYFTLNVALQQNASFQQDYKLKTNRDFEGNVCENFYDYTCSRWSSWKKDDASYSETLGLIDYEVNKDMLELIKSEDDSIPIKAKMRTYFNSCESRKQRRLSSYVKIVKPSDDLEWPIVHDMKPNAKPWESEKFDWFLTLAHLRKFGLNKVFLDQNVFQKLDDTKAFILDIDKPDSETRRKLPDELPLIAFLRTIGYPLSKASALQSNLTELQFHIFTLQTSSEEAGFSELTLPQLREAIPELNWDRYVEILANRKVDDDLTVRIRSLWYYKGLVELLNGVEPRLICTYLMIHFMYYGSYDGSKSTKETDCILDLRTKMDLAFQYLYYENFYKQNAQVYEENVNKIFESLRAGMRNRLLANKLKLEPDELEFFIRKLNATQLRISTLPKNFTADFIDKYYEDIEPDDNNYVQNQLDLLALSFRKESDRLTQPLKHIDDFFFIADKETARSSTPFYYARLNAIVIPFGLLRPPLFHPDTHEVYKYSFLGFNLAHELAHGFDSNGILYDYRGHLNLEMAVAISENAQYKGLVECMLQTETSEINERFADFVGLQLTLDAFAKKRLNLNDTVFGEPIMRPFFVNFALFFCGSHQLEFIGHDADKSRVEWALSQTDEFKEAFNCKKSDDDNINKCELW